MEEYPCPTPETHYAKIDDLYLFFFHRCFACTLLHNPNCLMAIQPRLTRGRDGEWYFTLGACKFCTHELRQKCSNTEIRVYSLEDGARLELTAADQSAVVYYSIVDLIDGAGVLDVALLNRLHERKKKMVHEAMLRDEERKRGEEATHRDEAGAQEETAGGDQVMVEENRMEQQDMQMGLDIPEIAHMPLANASAGPSQPQPAQHASPRPTTPSPPIPPPSTHRSSHNPLTLLPAARPLTETKTSDETESEPDVILTVVNAPDKNVRDLLRRAHYPQPLQPVSVKPEHVRAIRLAGLMKVDQMDDPEAMEDFLASALAYRTAVVRKQNRVSAVPERVKAEGDREGSEMIVDLEDAEETAREISHLIERRPNQLVPRLFVDVEDVDYTKWLD
ncbi:hypothetical protein CI109_103874 [Kwoniella shandongensis]|uniref:Uncharacterized protein n=1 Tax=Kwoniella shandongensis TaxID=1734106 RepID=A0AAJ8LKB9_9TREE